jgi:hypothetical protein
LKAPVLIVVGQVVALAAVLGTLAWDPEQAVCQERQARHA